MQSFFRDNIDISSQELLKVENHSAEIHEAFPLMKIDKKIDITVRPFVFLSNRTENANIMGAMLSGYAENLSASLLEQFFLATF